MENRRWVDTLTQLTVVLWFPDQNPPKTHFLPHTFFLIIKQSPALAELSYMPAAGQGSLEVGQDLIQRV